MNNINWDPIINAVLALVATIISVVVVPKVKKLLEEKLSKEQRENLISMVRIAVKAAEQIYGSKTGEQKKNFVLSYLNSKGINFDIDDVSQMIESEVYNLSNSLISFGEAVTEDVNIEVEENK